MKSFRKRLFLIIEPADVGDTASSVFDKSILILIVLNVTAVILESFQGLASKYQKFFNFFEVFSIIIFTIEYLLRIFTADYKYYKGRKINSILKYLFSPMALIDLLAILPFYLPMLISIDLRFLRILRLVRILRILKISRYTKSLKLIAKVLKRKKEELVITIFVTFLLLLLAASIMYYVEKEAQPKSFPNIIASLWWAVATLTTVGYGDIYPITTLGKLLSGVIAILGIGIVALPAGIISSGFVEEMSSEKTITKNKKKRNRKYPYGYKRKKYVQRKTKNKNKKNA